MAEEQLLYTSTSPHERASHSTASIMRDVIFAMIPIVIFSSLYFGIRALVIIVLSVVSAVLSEYIWQKVTKQKVTVSDCSAIVTGMLLAFNLPASVPWWMPIVGSAFAIIIVKQIFGGIGQNFMNPALAGRCFLLVAWSSAMVTFQIDGVTVATPLAMMQSEAGEIPSKLSCFLGVIPGSLGETSTVLILLGGIYLILRKVIDYIIPVSYIGTVLILSYLLGQDGIYQILTGGLMLGAFFMATDYTTSPMNKAGKWIMGVGCGLLTVLIRFYGGYPEGVSFSILLMNLCVPLIDRFTMPRVFGTSSKKAAKKKEEKSA
ncbi:MAG: RnfABCDGE type electron transport complex subunit D [Lachnospiraceae bacterium]|jgi:electron transport complex protein RnfD|nr:RnfABCDGE type electron transport complex subunit D [Lachnospiraceae bacterium]